MDKIDRFLDAIEYPERYTQSEIDAMLQDPEIKVVFDLLDKTKSSLQTQQSPDIEAEWRRFEKNHIHYIRGYLSNRKLIRIPRRMKPVTYKIYYIPIAIY